MDRAELNTGSCCRRWASPCSLVHAADADPMPMPPAPAKQRITSSSGRSSKEVSLMMWLCSYVQVCGGGGGLILSLQFLPFVQFQCGSANEVSSTLTWEEWQIYSRQSATVCPITFRRRH